MTGIKTQHYAIVVADVARFGTRRNPVQAHLRTNLYRIFDEAFDLAGIDRTQAPPAADRGDGAIWLLPGGTDKVALTGAFVSALHTGLRAYTKTASTDAAMRVRVALHHGEVGEDGKGYVGEDLNTACRLVDHPQLKATLDAAVRSALALAVSDTWYESVVRHDYPEVDRTAFRAVPFEAKEITGRTAWIHVPGYSSPPRVSVAPAGVRPSDGPAAAAAAGAAGTAGGHFNGATVNAQQVVAGDQTVHGALTFGAPPNTQGEGGR